MKYEEIFRDTKNWYKCRSNYASQKLVDFAVLHAGDKILDAGCATGDYLQRLGKLGYHCAGMDINSEYVNIAMQKGLDAQVMDAKHLKFPDKSYDTVLLFEVLEHVDKQEDVLKEVRRVARKNVLITVPNCTQFHRLRKVGLTYDHMLEKYHVNFVTKSDLESLLSKQFLQCNVLEGEPIFLGNIGLPRLARYLLSLIYKLRLMSPDFYFRLYAVARVI
ncbi:MAG: class I SAM-dependent methyltransferase [Methanothrix sp.]